MKKKKRDKIKIEQNKTTIHNLKDNIQIFMLIMGGVTILYPIINYTYELLYKIRCDNFYNIPQKYFSTNINDKLLYLCIILLLIIFVLIPFFIRQKDIRDGNKGSVGSVLVYSIIYGVLIGFFNILNLFNILYEINSRIKSFESINNFISNNIVFVVIVLMVLGVITLVGMYFVDLINKIKHSTIQIILYGVLSFFMFINLMLLLYGTTFKLAISVQDKTKYEIITNMEENLIVLTEVDDKHILVANYNIENGKEFQIITREYKIIENINLQYSYIDIKVTPTIIKSFED